jgi:predicted metal-dependent phosphoesterase TrpH
MNTKPLKVDFHIHTKEDPKDRIPYSAYKLIDQAFAKDYDALAITNHERVTHSNKLESYAAERGIVLIPGIEANINGKHVLLVNMPFNKGALNSFDEILKRKAANNLVIAPHPYFPGPTCLNGQMEATPYVFDAIEYCHLYNDKLNFNKEAVKFAAKHRLPVVGNSDAHMLEQFGLAYSLVEAEKETDAIIQAIKACKVKVVSKPLPLMRLVGILMFVVISERLSWKKPINLIRTSRDFLKRISDK